MKIPEKFKEYVWLVNTIHRYGRLSLAEINRLWVRTTMSGGVEMARATFCRHRDAIEDIFGLYIDCDRNDSYRYYIFNDDVLGRDTLQNWMLSTLSVGTILSESMSLNDRILPESIPVQGETLTTVLRAMKLKVRVKVGYRRYGSAEEKTLDFEPYCIKVFSRRWYVLGHFHRDATPLKPASDYFGIFSFDRILTISLTDVHFDIDPHFSAAGYFRECFGIYRDSDVKARRIVLRAYGDERFSMRDLPVHSSQRLIAEGNGYADFELFLRPTRDLSSYIMGRGRYLKVISPSEYADEIRSMLADAASAYSKND